MAVGLDKNKLIKKIIRNPPSLNHWAPSSNSSSHCSWPEITCLNNSVVDLSLRNRTINKTIPSFLCDLHDLKHIDLYYNNILGGFPTTLYNCSKLEFLDLSENYFVGTIPDDIQRLEIGNLSILDYLGLAYNMKFMPSKLPSSFKQLNNLKTLWMCEANLVGEIPEVIGDLTALEIDLSANNPTGAIPGDVGKLEKLTSLVLFSNKLSGEIPESIGLISTLTDVRLFSNNLPGKLSEHICYGGKLLGVVAFENNPTGKFQNHLAIVIA
ncbi:hypothetical protein PTKIN_Ptkin14bG0174300 [Pterospermum kingtungense]